MDDWSLVPRDTTPAAHAAQTEAYRRMGGPARSAVAFRLTDMARRSTTAGIRRRHPEYDDGQVQRALCRIVLGDAVCRALWPTEGLVDP